MNKNIQNIEIEKRNREILVLRKELEEQKGMNWVLREIIKISANLDSFKELMKNVTDMLMGVMGLDTCTIWIKSREGFKFFSRSIHNNNRFIESISDDLPDYLLQMDRAGVFDMKGRHCEFIQGEGVRSLLLVPLKDYKTDKRIGLIVGEHHSENYFAESRIDFFETIAIQISIAGENSKLFEKVNRLTRRDPLTNCYNRKYFDQWVVSLNNRQGYCTLAVFDVDNFKGVNDRYGHEKGDEILVAISELARQYAKHHSGKVIRYGGDEFVIIIYDNLENTVRILEKFRKEVIHLPIMQSLDEGVTVTIGVASYPEKIDCIDDLFCTADYALLKAKQLGKNRVEVGDYENREECT
jgi:diguanylate cyclase (GGDEF)-like protein